MTVHTVALVALLGAVPERAGYVPRPCGFDMDRDGIVGGTADRRVGDGRTRDPDGDGTDEDLFYVDSREGDDDGGDGSPTRPFRTIQRALDAADGPADGAEDIICISGVFHETLTIRQGGRPGHYEREGFAFPRDPAMLIGWDRDGDGAYPPFDPDDRAVLDGRGTLPWAVTNPAKHSYLEIAHLTIRDYGYRPDNAGALKLFRWGGPAQSHIWIHDVEFRRINRGEPDASGKIVLDFWGGPFRHVAFTNNLVDEYSSYFCRGAPPEGSGRFRFQGNTLRMHGTAGTSFVTGWKLWGRHEGVEILQNVVDCNAGAWRPAGKVSGVGVCQGTQDWLIRGNLFIDVGVTLQPYAKGYAQGRPLERIRIEGNRFRSTYGGWRWPPVGIKIEGYPDAGAEDTVGDVSIAGNIFTADVGWSAAILCNAGNGGGAQRGTIRIEGNRIRGPFTRSGFGAITITPRTAHRQERLVLLGNEIACVGEGGRNVEVSYAPAGFVADRNVYDPAGRFRWDETRHWITIPFDPWRSRTGQDAHSRLEACPPLSEKGSSPSSASPGAR